MRALPFAIRPSRRRRLRVESPVIGGQQRRDRMIPGQRRAHPRLAPLGHERLLRRIVEQGV
ncbi:MAG: hypothetical protein WDN69_12775 [Aliidongia sp.]